MEHKEQKEEKVFRVDVFVSAREVWEVPAESLSAALASVATGNARMVYPSSIQLIPEIGIRGVVGVEEGTGGVWKEVPREEIREVADQVLRAPADTLEEAVTRITNGDPEV